jgi:hypothetical protein
MAPAIQPHDSLVIPLHPLTRNDFRVLPQNFAMALIESDVVQVLLNCMY